jgi:hypothetical protein
MSSRVETGFITVVLTTLAKVISIDRHTRGYLRKQTNHNKHISRSVIDALELRSLSSNHAYAPSEASRGDKAHRNFPSEIPSYPNVTCRGLFHWRRALATLREKQFRSPIRTMILD